MEQNLGFDQDLLNLFSTMIDDEDEKLILELLFTKGDIEELLDKLVTTLEHKKK